MSNIKCYKCLCTFKYISLLKKHLQISSRCSISDEEINIYFTENNLCNKVYKKNKNIIIDKNINNNKNINKNINNNKNVKQNKILKCEKCNKEFSRLDSLNRHKNTTKCESTIIPTTTASLPTSSTSSTTPPITQSQTNINNSNTNSHNTTNNTIINNTDNSNNTIIQHINPFGFEDVRTIPISEMKTILNSGTEAGLHIIKAIYTKIENKNFYKPNISRSEVACLNEDLKLTIYKSREFADAFFDRCIALLHHMLYLCKHEFTAISIKYIYDNIEYIETTMRTEIYDKKLQSIIESEFINNNLDTKDRIKNFIKKIKEGTDTKDNSLLQIKNNITLKEDKNKEYKPSISSLELNNLFGDPKVILGLKKDEILLNLRISRFEESKFYDFWMDRITNIKKYVMNNKKSTIGDIANLKKEETKILAMLDIIKNRVDNNRGDDYLSLNVDDEFRVEDIDQNLEDTNLINITNLVSV
jgi:hypothetical protein